MLTRFELDEVSLAEHLEDVDDDDLPYGEHPGRVIEEILADFGPHIFGPPFCDIIAYGMVYEYDADMVLVVVYRKARSNLCSYSVEWDDIAPKKVGREQGGSFTRDDVIETMRRLVEAANDILDAERGQPPIP